MVVFRMTTSGRSEAVRRAESSPGRHRGQQLTARRGRPTVVRRPDRRTRPGTGERTWRTVRQDGSVARPSIVPIALTLDDRTGYTLWAPPWEEDGEEWQAVLGTSEDDGGGGGGGGPTFP